MLKLKNESLDWALKHALSRGDTDIFPEAFEYHAIEHDWDRMRSSLLSQDVLRWIAKPLRRCLSPKHRFGFRIATQLDPRDFLIFAALVYEIGHDLEKRRIPAKQNVVFSYRFAPQEDGTLYDGSVGYGSFQERSREMADSGGYSHVVLADIADFFPRLYAHRVENALRSSTSNGNHAIALKNLLAQWNEHMSYGIPVGPAPARLIAEVAIDDVDKTLHGEGAEFLRFIDDYRVFCKSLREAHQYLAMLATALFENHGLTLQQHKTKILPMDVFRTTQLVTDKEIELTSLSNKFHEIVDRLNLDNPYQDIEYDDLDDDLRKEIDSLNLEEMLGEQLGMDEVDIPSVRFVLRRLGQLDNVDCVETVLENIDKMYPVFTDVVAYLRRLRRLDDDTRSEIGQRVLALLDTSVVSHLEYHRMFLLDLFTHNVEWDNENRFAGLYNTWHDHFSQRKAILALGRANQDHWFRTRKRNVFDMSAWCRRALLAAGSCLPADERRHWYDSLEPRLDDLERAVVSWARQAPFP